MQDRSNTIEDMQNVGSICGSSNTISTVDERAARACRTTVATVRNKAEVETTRSSDHPEYILASRLTPKSAKSSTTPDAHSREFLRTDAIAKFSAVFKLINTTANLAKDKLGLVTKVVELICPSKKILRCLQRSADTRDDWYVFELLSSRNSCHSHLGSRHNRKQQHLNSHVLRSSVAPLLSSVLTLIISLWWSFIVRGLFKNTEKVSSDTDRLVVLPYIHLLTGAIIGVPGDGVWCLERLPMLMTQEKGVVNLQPVSTSLKLLQVTICEGGRSRFP